MRQINKSAIPLNTSASSFTTSPPPLPKVLCPSHSLTISPSTYLFFSHILHVKIPPFLFIPNFSPQRSVRNDSSCEEIN